MLLLNNKKNTDIWNSEVDSGKAMEKAEVIQRMEHFFLCGNTTFENIFYPTYISQYFAALFIIQCCFGYRYAT